MYDGGVREPLLARWPGGARSGSRASAPAITADLCPTLLAAAGLPLLPEKRRDATSLLALLRGEPITRCPIFWYYPHYSNQDGEPAAAARDGRWRLICFYDGPRLELYDPSSDV